MTTIDKIVEELNLTRVDFIKMDTEGAEKKALEGGRETIANGSRPVDQRGLQYFLSGLCGRLEKVEGQLDDSLF